MALENTMIKSFMSMGLLIGALALTGCATGPNPSDPFEHANRQIYKFNDSIDKTVAQPIARTYNRHTPNIIKQGIRNFFQNLGMISTTLNNIFQLKLQKTPDDLLRLAINTTAGVGGLFDIASRMGIPKNNEDFGQTLGYWGVRPGPYFMIPFIGPNTLRDGIGRPIDVIVNPVSSLIDNSSTTYALSGIQIVDTRARLLTVTDIVDQQFDPYTFIRDNYLKRRENQILDQKPPPNSSSPGAIVPQKSLLEMEKELFGDEPLDQF